jgi:biopolymer transport protein ExbD
MAADIFEEDRDDVIAHINVVPFVDIVLVLLIIFMLTSSVIVRASIPVDLPTAAAADSEVSSTLNIVMDAQGTLFLDGSEVSRAELEGHVARAAWKDNDAQAVISADRAVDYGRVVNLIDMVKSKGVTTFALNIQREE